MADGGKKTSWVFGPFRVTCARRLVERNDEIVRIGGRAFDVLVYLLEHAGQVVSHRALLEAVWPGTYVEEGNLRFQMAVLRRALGSGEANYIINVPGRGYCFAASVSKQDEVRHTTPLPSDVIVQFGSSVTSPANGDPGVTNILPYPELQPLLEKVRGAVGAESPDREGSHDVELYSKLDDLTLAIELVASQVKVFGIDKLSNLLEEHWLPDWPGHGASPPRHQTLNAMLDWSYRLLSETEKGVFRYISVFFGQFNLEAASAVVDKNIKAASILAELASKSLLSLDQSKFGTRYRLFDATRVYARNRLAETNEVHEARRRHAIFFLQALQNIRDGQFDRCLSKILTSELDDVLAAIIWGFDPKHDSMSCRRVFEKSKNLGPPIAKARAG
jgi:DNA-binding winged helix-turn-helix (wHTH) protein